MAEQETTETRLEDGGIEVDIGLPEGATTPPATVAETRPAEVAPQTPPAPQVGVEELRNQIKALETREATALRQRADLERIAREQATQIAAAQEEANRSRAEAQGFQRSNIDSEIAAAQGEADIARRDYQAAMETGDFAKASEANWRINKAASRMNLLEEKKSVLATEPARPHEGAVRPQGLPPQQTQPPRYQNDVEQFIADKSPRTQAWLRSHPETITDPRMNNKTVAAHYEALAEGYAPDTDSYFTFVDRRLGFSGRVEDPDHSVAVDVDPPRQQRRQPPPAAPVSRDAPRSERTNTRMYLTRGEQEVAEALGISPSEYARRKQAMEKQGYYHT